MIFKHTSFRIPDELKNVFDRSRQRMLARDGDIGPVLQGDWYTPRAIVPVLYELGSIVRTRALTSQHS